MAAGSESDRRPVELKTEILMTWQRRIRSCFHSRNSLDKNSLSSFGGSKKAQRRFLLTEKGSGSR